MWRYAGYHAAGTGALSKQIINTTHAVLDYRIDQVGPSGVGKVEVYMTTDQGQTWQRLGEDADRRSPVEFDLPGEGLFGIRLAVTNGNGFGGTSAAARRRADLLDRSRYHQPVRAAPARSSRWSPTAPSRSAGSATDKNLGAEPVNLYYRTRHDGPWQAIARSSRTTACYRWAFPRDAAAQFFVKVEVTDLAGNIARVETPNPVVLDMTEPRATVVGVTGRSVRGN